MSAVTARQLKELVEDGWAQVLEPVTDRVAAMGDFLRAELAAARPGYSFLGEEFAAGPGMRVRMVYELEPVGNGRTLLRANYARYYGQVGNGNSG